jgi:hypothetical protein
MEDKAPIELLKSGKVRMGWDGPNGPIEVVLRVPTVREQANIYDLYTTAAQALFDKGAELDAEPEVETDDARIKTTRSMSKAVDARTQTDSQTAWVTAQIIQQLGGITVEVDDLPIWASTGDIVARLLSHWRTSPLDFLPPSK